MYDIKPSGRGYVTLYVDGKFAGNFDTAHEAALEMRTAELFGDRTSSIGEIKDEKVSSQIVS